MEQYVVLKLQSGAPIWSFGEKYRQTNMEKKAPDIKALLANADLWTLMLKHFKTGKFRDSYFDKCLHKVMRRVPGTKNMDHIPDTVFVDWVGRCIHM